LDIEVCISVIDVAVPPLSFKFEATSLCPTEQHIFINCVVYLTSSLCLSVLILCKWTCRKADSHSHALQ